MKKLVLVSPHFPPSNLASVHRARLWSQHLQEFGWEPTILTTHPDHYEESLDWDLDALVPADTRVIKTKALPNRPVRWVGDIGIRSFPYYYRALAELAGRREIDFLLLSIPSNYPALLGRLLHGRYRVPYGVDYQDPWVHRWPGSDVPFTRAWFSARLASLLEPWAIRDADLITGVAKLYYEGALERNPGVRERAVTAAMEIGGSARDFETVQGRTPRLFDPADGRFHIVYAGALLPKAYALLERLLAAVQLIREQDPPLGQRIHIQFIGTGSSPGDPNGHTVLPFVRRLGLEGVVDEHPTRVPYVDVLTHLTHASAVLILGSTERHYTPSKAFQSVLSRRPVLAILHEESTAAEFLTRANAARVVSFAEGAVPSIEEIAAQLRDLVAAGTYDPEQVRWDELERYSARASARAIATALDAALARSAS